MFRAHVVIVRRAKIILYSLWYHHTYRWPSGAQIDNDAIRWQMGFNSTFKGLMYELKKKMERYLRVNLLGPGPHLTKKEFTGSRSHKG